MDLTAVLGLLLGVSAIVGGQVFEGGTVGSIMQLTAAVIVFGGTFGATMLSSPTVELMRALRMVPRAFKLHKEDRPQIIADVITMAQVARRDGLLALEAKVAEIPQQFLRDAVQHMVDGVEGAVLREILEAEIDIKEEQGLAAASVFETAGGYAPTIGIIGAVLGLIHVMSHLDDISKLGAGIAVAFVATIYGVGSANLFFLPMGTKLKRVVHHEIEVWRMMMEGVLAMQAGHNPHVIETRLNTYVAKDVKYQKAEAA